MSTNKKSPFYTIVGNPNQDGYISYAGNGGQSKFNETSKKAIGASNGISRAYMQDTFQNLRSGISARPEFTRETFE